MRKALLLGLLSGERHDLLVEQQRVQFAAQLFLNVGHDHSSSRVKAKVPTLSKGKTYITVTTRGGTSNSYTFTVR
jgi:hypothetical protein